MTDRMILLGWMVALLACSNSGFRTDEAPVAPGTLASTNLVQTESMPRSTPTPIPEVTPQSTAPVTSQPNPATPSSTPSPSPSSTPVSIPMVSSCPIRTYLVSHRNTNLMVGAKSCVAISRDENSVTTSCESSMQIVVNEDCSVSLRPSDSSEYSDLTWSGPLIMQSQKCLGVDAKGDFVSVNCAPFRPTVAWLIAANVDGSFIFASRESKLCLASDRPQPCDQSESQKVRLDFTVNTTASRPNLTAATLDLGGFNETQGHTLYLTDFAQVDGFANHPSNDPKTSYIETVQSGAFVEFNLRAPVDAWYDINPRYSSPFSGTQILVSQDGVELGQLKLRNTTSYLGLSEGPAVLVFLRKGQISKIRFTLAPGSPTFRLYFLRISPPFPRKPIDFGAITSVSTSQVTSIPAEQTTASYRINALLSPSGTFHWHCRWTYCYVDYDIHVPATGSYEFKIRYSTQGDSSSLYNAGFYLDGMFVGTLIVNPTPSSDTFMVSSSGVAIQLQAGRHVIRVSKTDTVNGVFALGIVNLAELLITP